MENLLNLKYDWAHSKIIYNSLATLYQQATVKIALIFWFGKRSDVEPEYLRYEKLQEKIQKLPLAEPIKEDITLTMELIGEQLIQLEQILPPKLRDQSVWVVLKDKIHWTSQGTIDKLKTAEAIIDSKDFDVETKFQTATVFCLEDQINALSVQMDPDYLVEADLFDHNIDTMLGTSKARKHFGIVHVAPDFKENFEKALDASNELACLYYWQCFTDREKRDIVKSDFLYDLYNDFHNYSNYMIFFFTLLGKKQKLQLVQNETYFRVLLHQLLSPQFLPVFYKFAKDFPKLLKFHTVLELLTTSLDKMVFSRIANRNYLNISSMLLHFISKNYSKAAEDHIIIKNRFTSSFYGSKLCRTFLALGDWKTAIKFFEWSCDSLEDNIHFYVTFFKSEEFGSLFLPYCLTTAIEAIVSFIKVNKTLRKEFSDSELISEACFKILSQCYFSYHSLNSASSEILFEGMDKFLSALIHYNKTELDELKKDIFIGEDTRWFIYSPLMLLYDNVEESNNWNESYQLFDDFFSWICSSDEKLQAKITKEFWNSDEVLKEKNRLNIKDFEKTDSETKPLMEKMKMLLCGC